MSQTVKLSDSLVTQARTATKGLARSVAGQVEFWAKMGQAIEPVLLDSPAASSHRRPATPTVFDNLQTVDSSAGRRRVRTFLKSQPFPHYQPHPKKAGLLVRIDADGSRTVGRFIGRRFHPVPAKAARR